MIILGWCSRLYDKHQNSDAEILVYVFDNFVIWNICTEAEKIYVPVYNIRRTTIEIHEANTMTDNGTSKSLIMV